VAVETSLSSVSVEENIRKMESYFVGVDVGTGSVRAALVTRNGKLLCMSSEETKTWNPSVGYFEQSTDDIWKAVCRVVKVKQLVFVGATACTHNCRDTNKEILFTLYVYTLW
jgi:predicted NBD/HSP70 family sugar kinase